MVTVRVPGYGKRGSRRPGKGINPRRKSQGKVNEAKAAASLRAKGYKIERTGWGADFIARKNGRKIFVEVKSGRGKMTVRQNEMKKKHGSNYKVIRIPDAYRPGG